MENIDDKLQKSRRIGKRILDIGEHSYDIQLNGETILKDV